jgi:rhamnulokinase
MLKSYLALDVGAGSGRAILGALADGRLRLEEIHKFPNRPVLVQGRLHWDLLHIWDQLLEGLKKAAQAGHAALRAIGIDTWNIDFGLLDAAGELLYNPVCYRSAVRPEVLERIKALIDEQTLYGLTGIGYLGITGLARLLERCLDQPQLLSGQARCYLPLADLLRYFLNGEKSIEQTILWGTQLADVRTRELSRRLLELFELPAELFPPRIPPGRMGAALRAEVQDTTGVGAVPVAVVAGHDTISALVSASSREQAAILCTGTWFILGTLLREPRLETPALRQGFLNEIAFAGQTYLARNLMGFYLLEGLRAEWGASYAKLIESAQSSPEFALDIDVNDRAFFSTLAPSREIGAYLLRTGQDPGSDRGAVARGLLEGLALSCRSALLDLERLTGAKVAVIRILGGAVRNPPLCQMIADATGRVVAAGPAEATTVGNIAMQMMACGELSSLEQVRGLVEASFPPRLYEPAARDIWEERAARRAGSGT